jgi:hypothetical protein
MELFVLLGIIVAVVGVALAAFGRHGRTIGGIERRPSGRPDHPEMDSRESFQQAIDSRGER